MALGCQWCFRASQPTAAVTQPKTSSPFAVALHSSDRENDVRFARAAGFQGVRKIGCLTDLNYQRTFAAACSPYHCRSLVALPLAAEPEVESDQQSGVPAGAASTASISSYPPLEKQRLLRVGLLGVPNSGKSQLTNRLVGTKVTAVSSKVNTTVLPHLGAFVDGDTQVVLHDLPGVVRTKDVRYHGQSERVETAWATASQCDRALFIVDAAKQLKHADEAVQELARSLKDGVDVGTGKV